MEGRGTSKGWEVAQQKEKKERSRNPEQKERTGSRACKVFENQLNRIFNEFSTVYCFLEKLGYLAVTCVMQMRGVIAKPYQCF
jgi:hypothetical protein